jgi:hypothetical protein
MAKPQEVLSSEDYRNYRNVRAVAVWFVVLGSLGVLGGIGGAVEERPGPEARASARKQEPIHPALAVGIATVGLTGVAGGIATLRGSRRWAPLAYVMAALYVFGFSLGTILSWVILSGLSRYLDSVECIRRKDRSET